MKHSIFSPRFAALGLTGATALLSVSAHAQLARVTATERLTERRVGVAPWQKAASGQALGVGDGLRTGRRSKADLKFADGSLLRLGQLSTVELKSAKGATLTGGRLLFSMLKPGRVLAGTAAAEIKGSVGIIAIGADGVAQFTLYSGAMDVVTDKETIHIPPGRTMSVFADGSRSLLGAATPLRFTGDASESSLLDAPSDAPFMGSRADEQTRFTSERVAIDSSVATVKQRSFTPFSRSVTPPPVVTPPVVTPTTPPVVTPTTPPVVTPPVPPVVTPTTPPVVTPPVVTPTTPPVVTPTTPPVVTPTTPPVVAPPTDGGGDGKGKSNGDNNQGDNNQGDGSKKGKALAPVRPIAGAGSGVSRFFAIPTVDAAPRPVRVAALEPQLPPPPAIAPGTTAEQHILQSNPALGRGFVTDFTGVAFGSGGGSGAAGARLRAIATRGRLSAEVAVLPTQLTSGGRSQGRFTLSDASLTLREKAGDLQVGRQRFLSGPTLATLNGSLVRQGGRQLMDAVTFRPHVGGRATVQLSYLANVYARDLPFRVRGRERGFYGRMGVQRRFGNFGLNVLGLTSGPLGTGTGVTADFALPFMRDTVEFYGEVGRDPFRRSLRTFGLAFPGLQTRTGLELYLEDSVLGNRAGLVREPDELALLAYKSLGRGVFLTGGFSHFSDRRNVGTLGLAFGARSAG